MSSGRVQVVDLELEFATEVISGHCCIIVVSCLKCETMKCMEAKR